MRVLERRNLYEYVPSYIYNIPGRWWCSGGGLQTLSAMNCFLCWYFLDRFKYHFTFRRDKMVITHHHSVEACYLCCMHLLLSDSISVTSTFFIILHPFQNYHDPYESLLFIFVFITCILVFSLNYLSRILKSSWSFIFSFVSTLVLISICLLESIFCTLVH